MVRKVALKLPNVEEGTAWGFSAFRTKKKMFLCFRTDLDSIVVRTSFDQRDAMIEEDPFCLRSFALISELHLEESMRIIVELSQRNSFRKVCARLVSLGLSLVHGINTQMIEIPVTHDEFASLCGTSRKTLERVLSELKQMLVIDIRYRSITILDLKNLSEIAAGDVSPQSASFQAAAS